jgi:hypothetical protein
MWDISLSTYQEILRSCLKTVQHKFLWRIMNDSYACRIESLIIFSGSTVGINPGKYPFYDPTFWQYFKRCVIHFFLLPQKLF